MATKTETVAIIAAKAAEEAAAAIAPKKARKPKETAPVVETAPVAETAAPAETAPVEEAVAPDHALVPVAAPASTEELFWTLSDKGLAVLDKAGIMTRQRGAEGLGSKWHTAAVAKAGTRPQALAAMQGAGPAFTRSQAVAALAPLKLAGVLGSGTPGSYWAAFVKCGYLEIAAAPQA